MLASGGGFGRIWRYALFSAALLGVLCAGIAGAGVAEAADPAGSPGTPAAVQSAVLRGEASVPHQPVSPHSSSLNVVVFGDSLGGGIWGGLYHALKTDKRFRVTKVSHPATGLVRDDYFDWTQAVAEVTAERPIDIAVILIGTNDRQPIVENGQRFSFRSPEWEVHYEARIDAVARALMDVGARVYWVGLPVMRSARFGADMQYFNALYERRAVANGAVYVPTWKRTAGEDGAYSAYGRDGNDRIRLLRKDDGVHFTTAGYGMLASFVALEIKAEETGTREIVVGREAVSSGRLANGPAGGSKITFSSLGLKAQIYDRPSWRPGRSDDWSWPRR